MGDPFVLYWKRRASHELEAVRQTASQPRLSPHRADQMQWPFRWTRDTGIWKTRTNSHPKHPATSQSLFTPTHSDVPE